MKGAHNSQLPVAAPRQRDDDLLQALMASLFDAVVIIDRGGVIRALNPAAEALFGFGSVQVVGEDLAALLPVLAVATATACSPEGAVAPRSETHQEVTGCRADGAAFPMRLNVNPVQIDGQGYRILVIRDLTEVRQAEQDIRRLTDTDSLTGVANRAAFYRQLAANLQRARHCGRLSALMVLDLKDFQAVNENHGHAVGDALLIEVARRLRQVTRRHDSIARLGGDEFALVFGDLDDMAAVRGLAERVIERITGTLTIDDCLVRLAASLGIAVYPHDDREPDELIRKAEWALMAARSSGKRGTYFYEDVAQTPSRIARILETELQLGLVREEFELHYQPKVGLDGRSVGGAEALIRWHHPDRGMVPPGEFIPVAETSDVMIPLGLWVLRSACRQNKAWQEAGLPPLRMAVNISARQFQDPAFLDSLNQVLAETGLDPQWLELEITEGLVMEDTEQVIRMFHQIHDLGIEISIDDFGTGYSSLSYLRRFPVQTLKIDRCFIRDLTVEPDNAAITDAVIKMGHSLNLKIIAEGVETREQYHHLKERGCDSFQGYFFSPPLPTEDFVSWWQAWTDARAG